jgi:branched-chain amino acid transport system substrate-binding protein
MGVKLFSFAGVLLVFVLIVTLFSGCSSTVTTQTSSPVPTLTESSTVPTQSSSTTPVVTGSSQPTPSSSTQTVPAKTIKIGYIGDFSSSNTLDSRNGLEIAMDLDNKSGGILVGGESYKFQLIDYDGKNDQATESAAINRLIFQDKVSFIISSSFLDAFVPITDSNKIITFVAGLNPADFTSQYNYVFNGNTQLAANGAYIGSICKNFPDKVKTVVQAFPDDQPGHFFSGMTVGMWQGNGVTPTNVFYPPNSGDFSAVATKVLSYNPTLFTTSSGSDAQDTLVYNAVSDAGFKGQFFSPNATSTFVMTQTLSANALEGFISGAWSYDFAPPLTALAKQLEDAWIAKYGSWQSPNIQLVNNYYCLKAALEKAGTLNSDQVANVLSNGLMFETPNGNAQMKSRPDVGQSRTVDSIGTYYLKQIHVGKAQLLTTITLAEAIAFDKAAVPAGPPGGGPPPGGPPPGPPPAP